MTDRKISNFSVNYDERIYLNFEYYDCKCIFVFNVRYFNNEIKFVHLINY